MIKELLNTIHPFHANYIKNVPSDSIQTNLEYSRDQTLALYERLTEEQRNFRYDENKWTPLEILLHMSDTEQVFSYRALTIARVPGSDLPGMDQDEFAAAYLGRAFELDSVLNSYLRQRSYTIDLFNSFSSEELLSQGTASGNKLQTQVAGHLIAGHDLHHLRVLREKYLL